VKKLVRRVLFYALLIGLWQGLYKAAIWSPMLFPSPEDVWNAMIDGFGQGTFTAAIQASLRRVVIGFLISVVIGLTVGSAMARWQTVQETAGSLVLGIQSLPSVCWAPLALMWFGLQEQAIIFVVVLGSAFSITEAAYAGFTNVPPLIRRAALVMGANQFQLFWRVLIPAALPSIVTGLKLSWSFAWRSLMAGELIAQLGGFGELLQNYRDSFDMPSVIAVMIVIVAIGLLVNALVFRPLEIGIHRRWGTASNDGRREGSQRRSAALRRAALTNRQPGIAQDPTTGSYSV
jgi:NitT/TauT family transport system permease protein